MQNQMSAQRTKERQLQRGSLQREGRVLWVFAGDF
jgi:hypothetical protein